VVRCDELLRGDRELDDHCVLAYQMNGLVCRCVMDDQNALHELAYRKNEQACRCELDDLNVLAYRMNELACRCERDDLNELACRMNEQACHFWLDDHCALGALCELLDDLKNQSGEDDRCAPCDRSQT
jgi:hypothetical protein